jgi:anthranilate/para-aminobenzoate synthase component I
VVAEFRADAGLKPQALAWAARQTPSTGSGQAQPKSFCFLFETQAKGISKTQRFSLWAGEPLFLFSARGLKASWRDEGGAGQPKGYPQTLWRALSHAVGTAGLSEATPGLCPLTGWLSYEAGRYFEDLPATRPAGPAIPDLYFFLPREWAWLDPVLKCWRFRLALPGKGFFNRLRAAMGLEERQHAALETPEEVELALRRWQALWAHRLKLAARYSPSNSIRRRSAHLKGLSNQAGYRKSVLQAKKYIGQGDILQANLSHGLQAGFKGSGFGLYHRLSKVNPSPFALYAQAEGLEVVSASPERLFSQHGDLVETRPIAGTHPRGKTPKADRDLKLNLMLSPKEQAEHLMLVDLERNDLGRVCRTGTVRVEEFMKVEPLSHVHHIVSRITGRLKPGKSILDLLAAGFPGGTITGAPKIRSMQIIAELEKQDRGLYTGSAGYWDPFHRRGDFNILIRTIVLKNGQAHFRVGAGIVADSDPQKEWEETLHKAAALIEALETT